MQNRTFGWLHRSLTELIEKQGINQEGPIAEFLEKTDQDQWGPGAVSADIADYFTTKKEVLFFAELVEKAISKEKDSFKQIEGSLEVLNNFYYELLNYAQQLK